jgi:hypothetical protein
VRAFTEQQLDVLAKGAPEEVERLVGEVRRLYEAEDRQAQLNGALAAMLGGMFQRLQGECRAVEATMRMLMPAAPTQQQKSKAKWLGDNEPKRELAADDQ